MAGNSKRVIIQIESTAGTGYRYTITKSKKNHPERVEYKKFDPIIKKHTIFKETKQKMKFFRFYFNCNRRVAQLVEHRPPKPGVAGSIPASPAKNEMNASL